MDRICKGSMLLQLTEMQIKRIHTTATAPDAAICAWSRTVKYAIFTKT